MRCIITGTDGHLDGIPEFFITYGASVNEKGEDNKTPLHYAPFNGDLNIVKFLVQKGDYLNTKDEDNKASLQYASEKKIFRHC